MSRKILKYGRYNGSIGQTITFIVLLSIAPSFLHLTDSITNSVLSPNIR